ncbi:hypothetical protein PFTANZ_02327 [Plasmodium falciparum Tanzania (2000708)]|uniref:Uncharacterized protein n=1 Tax=Plasmodium falciparum Tanzania (2000708) TaxID=1036725 RepID=A0A024W8J9_PLAFA|nr:hypothetical protein PFTANZ_02327 [Plasmodium falciparum Tanzania (2000708)]
MENDDENIYKMENDDENIYNPYSAPCFIPEEEPCRPSVQETEGGKTGKGIFPHSESSNNNVVPETEVTLNFISPDRDRIIPHKLIYNLMNDDPMSTRKFFSVSGGNNIHYISHRSHAAKYHYIYDILKCLF